MVVVVVVVDVDVDVDVTQEPFNGSLSRRTRMNQYQKNISTHSFHVFMLII